MEKKENDNKKVDHVEGYRTTIYVMIVIVALSGLFLGFNTQISGKDTVDAIPMITCWISGGILILFFNMLKDIINELRILNSKK